MSHVTYFHAYKRCACVRGAGGVRTTERLASMEISTQLQHFSSSSVTCCYCLSRFNRRRTSSRWAVQSGWLIRPSLEDSGV